MKVEDSEYLRLIWCRLVQVDLEARLLSLCCNCVTKQIVTTDVVNMSYIDIAQN